MTLGTRSRRNGGARRVVRPAPSRPLVIGVGLAALFGCLLVLGAIADDIREQEANALDVIATPLLHSLASPALDTVMGIFTAIGSTQVVVPLIVAAMAVLLWRRHTREARFLIVSIGGSVLLSESLKLIVHRPRPQLAWAQVQPEYSFPSGHSMNSLAFYVAVALIVWVLWGRRAGLISVVVAVAVALLVGTSRIYLGYHYFTDVVGGFLAGAAWLIIVSAAFNGGLLLRRWRAEAPA